MYFRFVPGLGATPVSAASHYQRLLVLGQPFLNVGGHENDDQYNRDVMLPDEFVVVLDLERITQDGIVAGQLSDAFELRIQSRRLRLPGDALYAEANIDAVFINLVAINVDPGSGCDCPYIRDAELLFLLFWRHVQIIEVSGLLAVHRRVVTGACLVP